MTDKKRKWLNVFDIVVILIVLAVGFVLYKVGVIGTTVQTTSDTQKVQYVLQLTPMRYGTEQKIKVGDDLIETTRKTTVGKVIDVEIIPAETYLLDYETGNYKIATIEDEKTAFVTLEVDCVVTEKDITTVDGQLLLAGTSLNVNGPGYFGLGTVLSFERSTVE